MAVALTLTYFALARPATAEPTLGTFATPTPTPPPPPPA
jgi:hypothetical protein